MNSAIISKSGASAGIGFAIPVDVVNRIATQLIRDGRVPEPGIGIVAASEGEATRLSVDGVIIVRTLPQSPAAKAGLEGAADDGGVVQDVITAANGQPVHSISDLANILEEVGVGNGEGSMGQDHETEAERREQSARTRDAAKPDEAGKNARRHIDPERLYKAIRFLKAHPEQQVRQFRPRIFDHGHQTMRGAYYGHAEHYFRSMSSDPAVK